MTHGAQPVHATAVSIKGNGVLLIGPSGAGKSDLALRLIDRGAVLICDDRVIVDTSTLPPLLRPAHNISGKIEVRGIGIIDMPAVGEIPLILCVMLNETVPRIPEAQATHIINGVAVPKLSLDPFAASAPIKIELALKLVIS